MKKQKFKLILPIIDLYVKINSLMTPEHLDYFFDQLQSTAQGVFGPNVKETFGRPSVVIAPEQSERLFDKPCSAWS